MTGPKIQTDDRGITVNKSLAWTMLVGLVTASLWLGNEIASTQAAIENFTTTQAARHEETLAFRRDTENRIRMLEAGRASGDSEIGALRREMSGLRQDVNELKSLIRALEQSLRQRP